MGKIVYKVNKYAIWEIGFIAIVFIFNSHSLYAQNHDILVPPPPFSDGIFPCSQCHAQLKTNPKRRILVDAHTDIVLNHDGENIWCLDCHNANNRDVLHLADGTLVEFKKLYVLCGQCHGPQLKDWEHGVHGRRTGFWNGPRDYLLCVNCHNPHSPKFKKLKPKPPPIKPGKIKWRMPNEEKGR